MEISPQAWGCTALKARAREGNGESPHRRGDVPRGFESFLEEDEISPQAWGCTGISMLCVLSDTNLPTGVGMYRWKHHHRRISE